MLTYADCRHRGGEDAVTCQRAPQNGRPRDRGWRIQSRRLLQRRSGVLFLLLSLLDLLVQKHEFKMSASFEDAQVLTLLLSLLDLQVQKYEY